MNFNFGEILTRAWVITWKHKILWVSGIVISLFSLLSLPINLMFNQPFSSLLAESPAPTNQQMMMLLLGNGLIILLSLLSIPVYVLGASIPSLGTVRLERNGQQLALGDLFTSVLPYFWRILGILLLIWGGMFAVLMVFMLCVGLLSVVTFGLAALCIFPLFLLFIPLGIFAFSMMEQGMAAVLVDDLGVIAAIQRAWELFKRNLGVMALMSVIIYFISLIVGMVISVPMMIPMFGFMLNMGTEPDIQQFDQMFRSMTLWMLAFSPVYALLQGILVAFMQSAWTLTYLRLTRKPETIDEPKPDPILPSELDSNKTLIAGDPKDSDKTVIAKKPDA